MCHGVYHTYHVVAWKGGSLRWSHVPPCAAPLLLDPAFTSHGWQGTKRRRGSITERIFQEPPVLPQEYSFLLLNSWGLSTAVFSTDK